MRKKIRNFIDRYCDWMELLIAAIVGIFLLFMTVAYVLSAMGFTDIMPQTSSFNTFLHDIFTLVVGIEFTKVLLKPSVEHLIEVLVFLVTRHVILSHDSPWSILVSVICIILLYSFHFVLQYLKKKHGRMSEVLNSHKSDIDGLDETALGRFYSKEKKPEAQEQTETPA